MPDDPHPPRRPFGERDAEERKLPFGARPPARRSIPDDTPREPSREPDPALPDVDEADPDLIAPFRAAPPPEPPTAQEPPVPSRPSEDASLPDPAVEGDLDFYLEEVGAPEAPSPAGAASEEDSEPDISDEPQDVPGIIAVRSQRRRGMIDTGVLKRREGLAYQSYPELDAEEAARLEAERAALARAQAGLRLRVIFNSLVSIFISAAIFATLFTWWTPNAFLPAQSVDRLSVALATATAAQVSFVPTLTPLGTLPPPGTVPPEQTTIGIVSGHRGNHPATGLPDPGAVCADGFTTEQQIVEAVAMQAAELLRGHGYRVDVLDEWDPRLAGYNASAMVSIHADSCEYINDFATGFKVASFVGSATQDQDARLVGCLITRYAETTGMSFHPSVTRDMTEYHTFAEIGRQTPGAIIEIGFMYLDRQILTEHPDVVALGVARGVLCYLRNEEIGATNVATPSPEP